MADITATITTTTITATVNQLIGGTVVQNLIDLQDGPSSYSGQAGKLVAVKATEDGWEFVSGAGTGDMTKAVYDTDNDGVVDNSELLQGQNSAYHLSRANHTGTQTLATISDAGTIASQNSNNVTITGGAISATTLTLKQSLTPTPTAEGDIQWDTDNNQIKIGDGASTLTFSDDSQLAAASHTHTESDITDLQAYLLDITAEPLSDLSDVTITSIVSGEILKWTGAAWINNTLAEAGIAAASHIHATTDITSGTFADARIAESNVTQHQAALTITESQISDLDHTDADAIHDNVSGEISLITEKVTPVNADLIIIEDSAASNAKKKVQVGNLPTGGAGEANTASNVGVGGVGVFKQKTGVDLEFKNVNAGSNKITITDDAANNEVDIDITEANLTLDNIGGTLSVNKGGTGSTTASGARTNLGLVIGTDVQAWDADLDTYATKTPPSGDVVGTTDSQTLTNKTLTTPTLTLKQSLTPTPTAEGDIQWDTDNNQIKVGDGASTLTFSDDTQLAAASHTHTESDITDLQAYLLDITGEPLSDLSDVTITSIASGEILKWSGVAWINNTLAEAGISAVGHTHAAGDITSGTFADARIAESNVTQHEAAINHDNLTGFVANEHIDHSTVTLTAGDGLSGGGTIAASRTFDVDINGAVDLVTPAVADELLISDTDNANAIRKADVASVVNLADHDALTNFDAAEHFTQASITTVGTVTTGTWQADTIAVDQGGTGQTTYTNGQLLIGNTTGNTLTKATLTEGEGIDITNGTGTITIAGEDATTANKGIASFAASDFDVASGAVSIDYVNGQKATTTQAGFITELATDAETNTGSDTVRAITPSNLGQWPGTSNITTVGTLSSGNADAIVSAASTTTAGKVELATAAETTTGTDAGRAVTPDGLAGSDYGKRIITMIVLDDTEDTSVADGIGDITFTIPEEINGWNLVNAHASVEIAGTTGTTDIQLHNITQTADMLTTKITIDSTELTSYTAVTPPVIDTANDDVATGDKIRVDIDAISTTAAKGLQVILTFQLP